jgi:hypothetical protein
MWTSIGDRKMLICSQVPGGATDGWPGPATITRLRSLLCPEHQKAFENMEEGQTIDWVDPATAEVKPVDGIQNALMTHCVKQPDFLTSHTALVEAVFRLFLTNGNNPMTSKDLGSRLNRPPETILRTLASARVYKGIRPYSV